MNYAKIKPVDVANGEGVRVSVFVSGCSHYCKGCFNYELWNYNAGQKFTCDIIDEILDLCSKDYITGLSLLGGEPLDPNNMADMNLLCYAFKRKFPNKTIWCYTGYEWEKIKQLYIMKFIDVLVDGKFVQELKDPRLKFRGSSNQRIIDVKKSLDGKLVFLRKDLMGENT
jgi:anaerobic ribonucleoside-triphosphate reductase activating protein